MIHLDESCSTFIYEGTIPKCKEDKALNKKVVLTLLLVGLTLMLIPLISCANAIEPVPGIPVVIRARGIALSIEEEELVPLPALLVLRSLLLKPIKVGNFSIAPLIIKDGVLVISETKYNITQGRGALVLEKHDIILMANGTGPSGENISLRLVGKWIKLPDETIFLIRMKGMVKFEDDGKLLLLMHAIAFPKPLPK